MVGNLAENVDGDCESYLLYEISAIQGCLSIEVNGRTVGTFRIVSYIVSVHCWGCPLSGGFHCLLLSHLQSSSQYSNQQSQCCGRSHVTWGLSTPSPHTKNQPANIRLLLHSWKHVRCTDLHLAALHSSLAHFTTHCSFSVIVLCVQLPWQQNSL